MTKSQNKKKKPMLNFGHILLGCRFDIWIRLLIENKFRISPCYIPQALLITLLSLVFFPFALLERLIFALPIRKQQPQTPLFILGHWRSGTTYLQNLLSRYPGFGFFDPVNTIMVHNAKLLKPILTPILKSQLIGARPMDNLEYKLDLPMEEVYALTNSSTLSFIHMLAFPRRAAHYISTAFVEKLSPSDQNRWKKTYRYLIKKQSLTCHGKPLVLKSPSNTACSGVLYEMFPDACFVHIHRNPYEVVASTIHTFQKIFNNMTLQDPPELSEIEDKALKLFKDIFEQLFKDMEKIPADRMLEVSYEEFEKDPLYHLEQIFNKFSLGDFSEAKPCFQKHIDEQKNYKKNKLSMEPRLIERINNELGFYFDHYGYQKQDPNK